MIKLSIIHSSLLVLLTTLVYSVTLCAAPTPAAPKLAAKGYFLIDYHSQQILAEKNADEQLDPASLTKLMTAYLVFKELKASNLKMEDKVTISKKAWRTTGSRMFVEVNKQVSVENLLNGLIVQSGNDASVSLAEYIAGSEDTFAQLMNTEAQKLGMTNSHFINSTGLTSKNHYTTARDIAKIASALIKDFPEYYHFYSKKTFAFNGITQYNRNKLLWRDKSVDGLKTGFTESAGYCLVTSAKRDNMRLISVIMGTKSKATRVSESQSLINYGYRFFETHHFYKAGQPLHKIRIWKGAHEQVELGLKEDLYLTIPRRQFDNLKSWLEVDKTVFAPIAKNTQLGILKIQLHEKDLTERPLIALQNIAEGSFVQKLKDKIKLWLQY